MAGMQGDTDYYRHRRLIGWGIGGLLLLIGVAVLAGAILRAAIGPTAGFGGFFFFPFGFFFFLFFLFFVFGWFRWWGWGGWRGCPMRWGRRAGGEGLLRRQCAPGQIVEAQVARQTPHVQESV